MSSWPPPSRPRAQISQLPYMRGLDGMRALAVVAVMVYHANHTWLSGGFLGVEIFFVISGYLITLLLIGEKERTGRVRLGQFWLRRARRLLPALFVMMTLLAVYLSLFNRRPQGRTRGDFIGGIFYGSNWYQIAVGQGYTATEAFAPLRHLWSLAVEEQFYLVWPLVMILILRKGLNRLPRVAMWLFAGSAAVALATAVLFVRGDVAVECESGGGRGYVSAFGRCININETLYLGTFSRASGLLLGAAFAMWWRPIAIMRGPLRTKGRLLDVVALLGLITLGVLVTQVGLSQSGTEFGQQFDPWLFRGGFFVTGIATLAVIAAAVHRGAWTGRILGNPMFNWVGTRSYGLYLFHWPIYQIIRQQAGIDLTLTQFVVAMAFTIPITELSYRFVEMPIRQGRLGEWFRGEPRATRSVNTGNRRKLVLVVAAVSALLGFAGVSIAVARNVCVGDIECSFEIAEQVQQTLPVQVPPPVDSTTTTAVADTTVPAPPPTTMPNVPAEVIRDQSGTQPAESTIATEPATTPPAPSSTATANPTPAPSSPPVALGESVMLGAITNLQQGGFIVDATKSRQGDDMAALVEALRAQGRLGRTVVIQIGTNGAVYPETFARIMAQLPPNLTPQVVFLTVRSPRRWNAANNEIIRSLPTLYPDNVSILDWEMLSGNADLCADDIHIACGNGAAQYYANQIFTAVGRPDLVR